jgi:hypothetical protein
MARTLNRSFKPKVTQVKASHVKKGTILSLANAASILDPADLLAAPASKCTVKSKVVFDKPPSPSIRYKAKDYSRDILTDSMSIQQDLFQEVESHEEDNDEACTKDPNLYVVSFCICQYKVSIVLTYFDACGHSLKPVLLPEGKASISVQSKFNVFLTSFLQADPSKLSHKNAQDFVRWSQRTIRRFNHELLSLQGQLSQYSEKGKEVLGFDKRAKFATFWYQQPGRKEIPTRGIFEIRRFQILWLTVDVYRGRTAYIRDTYDK